jgi:hypothetical protein|nr:MAG TPA: ATPase [Caudoviricetes sp.]
MKRAISNKNVLAAKFEVVNFEDEWLRSFGRPELCGAWLIYGGSGSGKTTFTLRLCKYLTRFAKVAYNSLEQGLSLSMQTAWERVGMAEAGSRIMLLDKEGEADLRVRLRRKHSPDVVVIDSVHYWHGFRLRDYISLRGEFPHKLFIFIAHERAGKPDGKIAEKIRYDGDIKIHVEGYKAFITTRYEIRERGEGGEDFVIWEQGARDYWGELSTEE